MTKWNLLFRYVLLNAAIVAVVAVAWQLGYLNQMWQTDIYHLVKINLAIGSIGLGVAGFRAWWLSRELNLSQESKASAVLDDLARGPRNNAELTIEAYKQRIGCRLATVRYVANFVVGVGLAGTLIGAVLALSSINLEAASDTSAIVPMVTSIFIGLAIALYKTLVGTVLHYWLMLNYRMLETAATHLVCKLYDVGAVNVRQ